MRPARRAALVLTACGLAVTAGPAAAAPADCWSGRVDAARTVADGRPGQVAFAMVDPSGREWAVRGRRGFPSASLLKTTLMIAHLRRPGVRNRPLTARERNLLGPMIRRSDNGATNTLITELPRGAITQAARVTGQREFRFTLPIWGLSTTSALDQARLFARLSQAVPSRHRAYARSLLRTVVPTQRWGLPTVTPDGWTIMFKGGWGSGTGRITSQAARLESKGRVWTIAVLTERNPNHAAGVATITSVAKVLLADGPCPVS